MLNINSKERDLDIFFLHFLYLSKENKENKFVERNGLMPSPEDAEEPRKGYKATYLITLRKYLSGILQNGNSKANDLKITKDRSRDSHLITPAKDVYYYGSSSLIDNLLSLKLKESPLNNFSYKNHDFSFDAILGHNHYNRRSLPFSLVYNWRLNEQDQVFLPEALEKFEEKILENQIIEPVKERKLFANNISLLLTKMERDGFFSSKLKEKEVSVKKKSSIKVSVPATRSMNIKERLANKYDVAMETIDFFKNQFDFYKRNSEGLQDPQIFQFVITILENEHRDIGQFQYNDFEDFLL